MTKKQKEDSSCRGTKRNGCSLPLYCQKNIDANRTITPCHFQSFPCQRRADRQRTHERGRERQGKGAGSARGYVSGKEGASNTIICYQNIVFFKYLLEQLLLMLVGFKLPFSFAVRFSTTKCHFAKVGYGQTIDAVRQDRYKKFNQNGLTALIKTRACPMGIS